MPYRIEYAAKSAAACKGPKPCAGTKIQKGELRLGTLVEVAGNASFAWRHWGCVTDKQIAHMKEEVEEASNLDGYEDLRSEDQSRIETAFADGHIAEVDKSTNVFVLDPFNELSSDDLKMRLGDAGLKKTGTKDELVARLREHEGPIPEQDPDDPLNKMSVAALKQLLTAAGQKTNGQKPELVMRCQVFGLQAEVPEGSEKKGKKEPAKKKAKMEENSDEDVKPSPSKKMAASTKKGGKKAKKEELDEGLDEEPAPETKKRKRAPAKKKVKKEDSEEEEEAKFSASDSD